MPEDKKSENAEFVDFDLPDFYANNVLFESSVWDLKMHFRQLDQREGKADLEHRGTVTIPWLQAKIMAFYLQLNIDFYELDRGKILVPANVLPPTAEALTKPEGQGEESGIPPWAEVYKRLHQQFFGSK